MSKVKQIDREFVLKFRFHLLLMYVILRYKSHVLIQMRTYNYVFESNIFGSSMYICSICRRTFCCTTPHKGPHTHIYIYIYIYIYIHIYTAKRTSAD